MDTGFSGFRQYEAGAWSTAALHYRCVCVSMAVLEARLIGCPRRRRRVSCSAGQWAWSAAAMQYRCACVFAAALGAGADRWVAWKEARR